RFICCKSSMIIITLRSLSYPSPAVAAWPVLSRDIGWRHSCCIPIWTHAPLRWFLFHFWVSGICWLVCFFSRVWKVYSAERLQPAS
uniref:Uncharacterized protein n=1 Tax=Oryctolagus cuniculus TaxID=9986 RepID=A0A5F9CWI3_RABIT